MSISKKMRFEVFKRDGFKCAYCGQTPPAVVLEVDHIDPVSKGGKDVMANLITACFDCNRGKTNNPLSKIPPSLAESASLIAEKEEQIKQYRKLLRTVEKRKQADIDRIDHAFTECFPGWSLSDRFKHTSLTTFIERLPISMVERAMYKACGNKAYDRQSAIPYFCGICWRLIKEGGTV